MANQAHIMSTRHLQPYRQADFLAIHQRKNAYHRTSGLLN